MQAAQFSIFILPNSVRKIFFLSIVREPRKPPRHVESLIHHNCVIISTLLLFHPHTWCCDNFICFQSPQFHFLNAISPVSTPHFVNNKTSTLFGSKPSRASDAGNSFSLFVGSQTIASYYIEISGETDVFT